MENELQKGMDELGIELPETFSEDRLLDAIAQRVSLLIDRDIEGFMQIMYRMDIPEAGLVSAFGGSDTPFTLAKLIVSRQKMKAASRAQHSGNKPAGDDELAW